MAKKLPLKIRIENYLLSLTPEKIKQCPGAKEVIAQIKRERKLERKRNYVQLRYSNRSPRDSTSDA